MTAILFVLRDITKTKCVPETRPTYREYATHKIFEADLPRIDHSDAWSEPFGDLLVELTERGTILSFECTLVPRDWDHVELCPTQAELDSAVPKSVKASVQELENEIKVFYCCDQERSLYGVTTARPNKSSFVRLASNIVLEIDTSDVICGVWFENVLMIEIPE